MDGTQVGVLKQTNKVGLRCLLEGGNSSALESEVGLVVLSNLTNQSLEGQLADEQLSALLVAADLAKRDRSTGNIFFGTGEDYDPLLRGDRVRLVGTGKD